MSFSGWSSLSMNPKPCTGSCGGSSFFRLEEWPQIPGPAASAGIWLLHGSLGPKKHSALFGRGRWPKCCPMSAIFNGVIDAITRKENQQQWAALITMTMETTWIHEKSCQLQYLIVNDITINSNVWWSINYNSSSNSRWTRTIMINKNNLLINVTINTDNQWMMTIDINVWYSWTMIDRTSWYYNIVVIVYIL